MNPIRRLAVSVFVQALRDARSNNGERLAARSFLLQDNPDFRYWCSLLDVEPEKARDAIRRQLQGRKPADRAEIRRRILAELKRDPNRSYREIGRVVGCHPETIRQVRLKMAE